MENEPKYVEETLRWCNARRKERGKSPLDRLPKGERTKGESCPCGAATGLFVTLAHAYVREEISLILDEGSKIDLPRSVQRFVKALIMASYLNTISMPTTTERVVFKLIQMPCCGHLLCWVNPRYPTFCPQCGENIFTRVKEGVRVID